MVRLVDRTPRYRWQSEEHKPDESPGTATLISHRSALEDGRDKGQKQGRDRKYQADSNKGKTLHTIEYFKSSNEAAPLKEVWTTEDAHAFIFHLHPDQG